MVKHQNECCGCAIPAYPCMGESCSNRHVPHYFCDDCGEETKLYEFEGKQLCIDCIQALITVVEGSE